MFTSPFVLLYGFGGLILLGGLLLMLPFANRLGGFTPPSIAFFTATSAVTVTGLVVVSTSDYWTTFGQGIIFALVLVGGLGFMTLATFFLILMGQRITLAERLIMRDTIGADRLGGLVRLTRNVVLLALVIYTLGALALFFRFSAQFPRPVAVWQAVFHSVSAFNNAGFSILPGSSSLSRFMGDFSLLGTMALLIILGGISYSVLVDLFRERRFSRLSLDTRMVISASLFLWLLGALVIFVSEYASNPTLGGLSLEEKGFYALFHSINARTAGFTTLDFNSTQEHTNLFLLSLMFVGGAAGSTAGGIKVNTFAVIVAAVLSSVRGRLQVEAFGREIPHFQVHRALTVAVLALSVIFAMALLLTLTEGMPFLNLLFETFSAFATVGYSTGITPALSVWGKVIIIFTMFIGRLGPLTLALALAPREERAVYRFAQERVRIG